MASRRRWLKGFGALLGSGLLAAPAQLLAQDVPAAPALPVTAGSDLVGGDEYIGIVKLLTGATVPAGWALCDGSLLPINEHPALFTLLGTAYGGDGISTFALPKLHHNPVAELAVSSPEAVTFTIAMKTANAPATTTAVAELRLRHHRRPRPAQTV